MTKTRWAVLAVIVALVAAFFALGLDEYLSLERLQQSKAAIDRYREAQPVVASLLFVGIYVAVTALSLPGAGIMTLAGGAAFGLLWGVLLVSFASAIGATLAFLSSRFIFHDAIQDRFGDRLSAINAGMRRDGAFYLFSLRLIPVFPFFIINVLMGLTPIKVRTFYWVSQVGMLPLTLVFVNAGTELAKVEKLQDILSPTLLGSLVLIGLFPLVARFVVEKINARRHRQKA
jgi:uncharacterized membrane protein YdjX (TVP38/TMEM64 family)